MHALVHAMRAPVCVDAVALCMMASGTWELLREGILKGWFEKARGLLVALFGLPISIFCTGWGALLCIHRIP